MSYLKFLSLSGDYFPPISANVNSVIIFTWNLHELKLSPSFIFNSLQQKLFEDSTGFCFTVLKKLFYLILLVFSVVCSCSQQGLLIFGKMRLAKNV